MSEWKECRIGDLVERITSGGTPSTKIKEYYGGMIPWLNTKEINFNRIYSTELTITEEGVENSSAKWIKADSVIVAMYGATAGKVAINKIPLTTNQACCNISLDPLKADYRFIYYYLLSSYAELQMLATGAAQQNLNAGMLSDFLVKLPSLPEQRAIAAVLSSLDDKIDLLHRQNKTLESLAETLWRKMFVEKSDSNWKTVTLKECCLVITKGTTPTTLKKSFVARGINFIKVNCIDEKGNFITEKFDQIDHETDELLKRSRLKEGDILYSIAGTIGRMAIVSKDILPANTNQALAILRINNNICNSVFIKYCLRDKLITEDMHSKIVHAVQPNLSLGEIANTVLPRPPDDLLDEFISIIEPIELKLRENKSQIRTLSYLRDTLLPKLMSGEVKVKVE